MATSPSPGAGRALVPRWVDHALLALLAYGPILLSSPGRISADTKQHLYLEPSRFLARATYAWDAQIAGGGVAHQHIGYLWPMGPWFWLMEALGVPDWIAQRLWVGTIGFLAALGMRWLLGRMGVGRAGALAGTLVYLLTPYQLAFTARTSVLLLPWAGLPWLLGLTDRSLRDGGWRDPALIALTVLTIGAVNASSLVLIGIGPLVWILLSVDGRAAANRAVALVGKVALLGFGVSLWWIAALRLQASHGMPVLQLTENLETVARTSTPSDVLRGLGNWFFYGMDRLGFAIDQAEHYLDDRLTVAATFGLSAVAVTCGILVRWAHRARFAALVVVGTVVAVGAWPIEDPSPYARGVASLSDTAAGLALRNTARAAPLIVLGLAGLVAAFVGSWRPRPARWGAFAIVAGLAAAGLWPVAETGMLSEHLDRGDPIPAEWSELAQDLDREGTTSRVLEIPGSNFAAHRWGNTVDPVLVGLMDRPQLSREVLPQGSPSSALLLDALDRRLQEGVFEPTSLAAIARLLGADDIVLRSDLEYERYRTPHPRDLWHQLTARPVPGLDGAITYGTPARNTPTPELPELDEIELRTPERAPDPPPIARFEVLDPVGIVRVDAAERPIVLSGDGEGIVDAAAAGLLDGRSLVLQSTQLDDDALADALDRRAELLLTDTYRERIQTWFYAIRDTRGPTERAGEELVEPTGYDHRLDPTPDAPDDERSHTQHEGGAALATLSGGAARPEDRAAMAFDRDPRTSWRIGGADPRGERLTLEVTAPIADDHLVVIQPQDGPRDRWITEVRLRVDGGEPVDVRLDETSFTPAGQAIPLPAPVEERLDLEISDVAQPPFDPRLANAVGFAEVRLGQVAVTEYVVVPVGLLERADGGLGHPLDIVLTRLRYEPGARDRQDQERALHRLLTLPTARSFGLSGTIRVNPNAPDAVLDDVLGTDLGGARIAASSHLAGDLSSRASRAFDGDPTSAWQAAFGPQDGQQLEISLASPGARDLRATVVRDDRHSVAGALTLLADGAVVGSVEIPEGEGPMQVRLPDPPPTARGLVLRADSVRARTAVPGDPNPAATLPVAISEVTGAGIPQARDAQQVDAGCRPLLSIDGTIVSVRAVGSVASARSGLTLEPCGPALQLAAGEHRVDSVVGLDGGFDVDRVVLSSSADGRASAVGVRGASGAPAGARLGITGDVHGTSYDLAIETDGAPFWLVLGQSDSAGWELDVEGATAGPRQVVDGYANGWLVTPDARGPLTASVRWAPQRTVWAAMAVSIVAIALCVAIIVASRRRVASPRAPAALDLAFPEAGLRLVTRRSVLAAGLVGAVALLVSTPETALLAIVATVLGCLVPRATWLWAALAPGFVLAARALERPSLAWVAVALLAVDVVVEVVNRGPFTAAASPRARRAGARA